MTKKFISSIALILCWVTPVLACDPCSLYNVRKLQEHSKGSISLALSEQYTKFERVVFNNVANTEYTNGYSTTQLSANYDALDSLGLQLNVPYVVRSFVNRQRFQESNDYDTGLGDISLGANYSPFVHRSNESSAIFSISAAVKLPTGDTGSLSKSSSSRLAHHTPTINGASGGRTLTLGTGSVDYLIGSSFSARYEKILWLSSIQYAFRDEGDFGYRFDNDLVWNTGPGAYLILKDDQTLALRAVFSGEHKGKDTLNGVNVQKSSISNLYLGPEVIMTVNRNWVADLGLDIPSYVDQSDTTLKPSWRVRTSISYRF